MKSLFNKAKPSLFGSYKKSTKMSYITYGVVIVSYVVLMILTSTGGLSYTMEGLLAPICGWIIVALSLNLTVGILGELSLGHAGFMSIGAFTGATIAIVLKDTVSNDILRLAISVLVSFVFAAVAGFLIGIPVLRLKGDYLAIVTLAFGEIIKSILFNLYLGKDASGFHVSFFNDKVSTALDSTGKMLIKGPNGINGIKMISTLTTGTVLIIITLIIIFNLVNSRTGRAVMSVRDNPIAAESVGINLLKYKMIAFTLSAGIAGVGGAFYVLSYPTITANKFDFNTSILILVFVVLGGQGNMLGTIISATVLTILPEVLREFSEYRMLVYAIVLILVMICTNNSTIRGFFANLWDKIKGVFEKNRNKKQGVTNNG